MRLQPWVTLLAYAFSVTLCSAQSRPVTVLDTTVTLDVQFPVCEGSHWKDMVTFTKHPDNITNISNWDHSEIWDYVGNEVIPRATVSFVFLAFSLAILIGFIVWRIVRCSAQLCCNKLMGKGSPQAVLKGNVLLWTKVVAVVICLGIVGTSISALVDSTSSKAKGGMDRAWITMGDLSNYTQQVVDTLNLVVVQANATNGHLRTATDLVSQVPGNNPDLNAALNGMDTVSGTLTDVATNLPPHIQEIYDNVVARYDNAYADHYDDTIYYWNQALLAARIALGIAIGFAILLAAVAAANWGWGISIMVILQLLLAIVFFLIACFLGVFIVFDSDGCDSMEGILITVSPEDIKPLTSYYVNPYSQVTQLEEILTKAASLDTNNITNLANQTLQTAIENLDSGAATLPSNIHAQISAVVLELLTAKDALINTIDNVLLVSSLVQVQPLYGSTKSYLCCDVPSMATKLWSYMTALGWLALGLTVAAFIVLALLDTLPGTGPCCLCGCIMVPSSLPSAGKTMEDDSGLLTSASPPAPVHYSHAPPPGAMYAAPVQARV